jgi:probable HAF family extracellular repeat protein
MKRIRMDIVALTLLAALAMPLSTAAQAISGWHRRNHHYKPIDMGTYGGPNSSFVLPSPEVGVLTNTGIAVGGSDTSASDPLSCWNFDCYLSYAFRWQNGVATQLDALPGFNSSFPFWVSDNGLVAGVSENGTDPLTGSPAWEAILWGKDSSIHDLGTLGGNSSSANTVNSHGEVAGEALNTISDPYASIFLMPGATQTHAFRWTESQGLQDLGTLGGPDSAAFLMNERGQIAGWSFTSANVNSWTGLPTLDPFLWENGTMVDLGTLGGTLGETFAMNRYGQVAGFSDMAGDFSCHPFFWDKKGGIQDLGTLGGDSGLAYFVSNTGDVLGAANLPGAVGCDAGGVPGHAFLWRNGVMTDLGTAAGDTCSGAIGMNARGQIIGGGDDCNGGSVHAFLWEDGGPAVDLDALIPADAGIQLTDTVHINDSGEIAAVGTVASGDVHAFVLIPCDENHPGIEGCDYSVVEAAAAPQAPVPGSVPGKTRQIPRWRRASPFHIFGIARVTSGTASRGD